MADEPQVIRGIDWKQAFPFTLIFRSFRIAIHPSNLVLALLAVLLIYIGGNLLDAIWPARFRAVPDELRLYEESRRDEDASRAFQNARKASRDAIVRIYEAKLKQIGHERGDLDDIEWAIKDKRARDVEQALKDFDAANKTTSDDRRRAENLRDAAIRAAYDDAAREWERYSRIDGTGLFTAFYDCQVKSIYRVVQNARMGAWVGNDGVFDWVINFFVVGPSWAFRYHPVYFTIFGVYFLVVWAIFGGAITRIAAVQVARDEKISFRQALSFSTSKFLSFVSAPIIPLLIVVMVGLVVSVGGLFINIPFVGPIAGGALFFLALGAGFVMTLVLIGLGGGFNLMYPTVAVEGSDSFDAIARSFSYVYARPWRMAFYTAVAILYGALTYTFVRYFIKVLLSLTHYFAGLFIFVDADNKAPLWPMMWPSPLTGTRLSYDIEFFTLGVGQSVGAFLIAFWVYLAIAMLGAFAISFYFSANTIIYILMRHEVDATELDDVYLEQAEEEFAETAPAAAPPPAEQPAPAEPPPSQGPSGQGTA